MGISVGRTIVRNGFKMKKAICERKSESDMALDDCDIVIERSKP